jgi:hypothetical protein
MHLLMALLEWLGRTLLREVREAWAYWVGTWTRFRVARLTRGLPGPDCREVGWMTLHPALVRSGVPPGWHGRPARRSDHSVGGRSAGPIPAVGPRATRSPVPLGNTDPPKPAWPFRA